MADKITRYRVFIASPGGLDDIRQAFREILVDYSDEMDAMRKDIVFRGVGWEETLGGHRRAQALINDDLVQCDALVLVLWDRWGSPPNNDGLHTSGTEEEWKLALECLANEDRPMRHVVAFFRGVEPRQLADPGNQLQQVLDFKKGLEAGKTDLYRTFDTERDFRRLLRKYLAAWVWQTEKGEPAPPAPEPAAVEHPESPPEAATENPLLEEAGRLANEGQLTAAETVFAKAITAGNDPDAFYRYGHFLRRVGRLDQAAVMYERVVEMAADSGEKWRAIGLGDLGLIYRTRGELDKAEQMHRQALEIDEKLGRREGVANQYTNLGLIYQTRGELDKAEQMHRQALEIDEKLGRPEGMAAQYGNLGLIYQTRGELDKAEQMHRQALEIFEQLGHREGIATQYCNLGLIYQTRRELDKAEQMLRQALEIFEQLRHRKGMATQYDKLGLIYKTRGELDKAEQLHRQALEIDHQLGCREGMANVYANLGEIYKTRGELEEARRLWTRSCDLFSEIGAAPMVEQVQGWLDGLDAE